MDNSVTTNHPENSQSFEVKQRLIELRKRLGLSFVEMAGILKHVKESRMYYQWGYKTFEEFIADPDISMSRSTAYGLIQVWDTWVDKYHKSVDEIAEVPYDKLLMVAPLITEENADDMFHTAKSLTRGDINHLKREAKANEGKEFKPMPKVWRCPVCDGWKWEADPSEECSCPGR